MSIIAVVGCIVFIFYSVVLFYRVRNRLNFWKNRKIPHSTPNWFLGNMTEFKKTKNQADILKSEYKKFRGLGPFFGFFYYTMPTLVVTNLDLIKRILMDDFKHFSDRDQFFNSKDDPVSGHLANLTGDKWKELRGKLTPAFSCRQLKLLIPTFEKVGNELILLMNNKFESRNEIVFEIRDLISRYTIEGIGRSAFGIRCNCICEENSDFLSYAKKSSSTLRHSTWTTSFMTTFPKLSRAFKMKYYYDDVSTFFTNLVQGTIESREKVNYKSNDFMNILIDLKNSGKLNVDEVVAQTFIFLAAGNETSALTITYCLYELAHNHRIQQRLREEIRKTLDKDGTITYEAIKEMEYLTAIVNETMRKYFMGTLLKRMCSQDYKVGNFIIEKDVFIIIPVDAIHNDPEIYSSPEEFDPERFAKENIAERHKFAFLPFGEGPRKCIGMQFGELQTKTGIISLINNYEFSTCDKTQNPIKMDVNRKFLVPENGIHVSVKKAE